MTENFFKLTLKLLDILCRLFNHLLYNLLKQSLSFNPKTQNTMNAIPTLSLQAILRILQQTGRLKDFLLTVPLNDLQQAVEEKQLRADLIFRHSREQQVYKKNVLDLTMQEIIRLCHQENLIRFPSHYSQSRWNKIKDHPKYGYMLIESHPDKYYIGEKSSHFNKGRQIQRAYGIIRNSHYDLNSSESEEQKHQDNEDEEQDLHLDDQADENQAQNNKDDESFMDQNSDENFIVQDSDIPEDQLIEDSFEEQIHNRRKQKRGRRPQKTEERPEKHLIVRQKAKVEDKTSGRKLKKATLEEKQQISELDEQYLIDPEQYIRQVIQAERSKRNQKKIKQQLKRLQSQSTTIPAFSSTNLFLEDKDQQKVKQKSKENDSEEEQEFIAPRRSKKMHLNLD